MRIALISFEFAGDKAGGGIGTYIRNAAAMLSSAGHDVCVICGGASQPNASNMRRVETVRIDADRDHFPTAALPAFRERHSQRPFDVIEGPEFGRDAQVIANEFPEIPLVVRIHGPSFSINRSNAHYVSIASRLRFALGALRRGRLPSDPWKHDMVADPERLHALQADEIVANSHSTAAYADWAWGLPKDRTSVVPYPFIPNSELLNISPNNSMAQVLFLGRIEVRKGVLDLASAIPQVLKRHPSTHFRFVGRILPHPGDGRPVSEHILRRAGVRAQRNIEIVDGIPYDEVPGELRASSICVFPSDWEASGFVCLEAMSAARPVIGSMSGGMAEIIEDRVNGLLVPHRSPNSISSAICYLLEHSEERQIISARARDRVVQDYNPDSILPLQIASYDRAIFNASKRPREQRFQP